MSKKNCNGTCIIGEHEKGDYYNRYLLSRNNHHLRCVGAYFETRAPKTGA